MRILSWEIQSLRNEHLEACQKAVQKWNADVAVFPGYVDNGTWIRFKNLLQEIGFVSLLSPEITKDTRSVLVATRLPHYIEEMKVVGSNETQRIVSVALNSDLRMIAVNFSRSEGNFKLFEFFQSISSSAFRRNRDNIVIGALDTKKDLLDAESFSIRFQSDVEKLRTSGLVPIFAGDTVEGVYNPASIIGFHSTGWNETVRRSLKDTSAESIFGYGSAPAIVEISKDPIDGVEPEEQPTPQVQKPIAVMTYNDRERILKLQLELAKKSHLTPDQLLRKTAAFKKKLSDVPIERALVRAIDVLVGHLNSKNAEVAQWASSALAYLEAEKDYWPDSVPILGLQDDLYVVGYTLSRIQRLAPGNAKVSNGSNHTNARQQTEAILDSIRDAAPYLNWIFYDRKYQIEDVDDIQILNHGIVTRHFSKGHGAISIACDESQKEGFRAAYLAAIEQIVIEQRKTNRAFEPKPGDKVIYQGKTFKFVRMTMNGNEESFVLELSVKGGKIKKFVSIKNAEEIREANANSEAKATVKDALRSMEDVEIGALERVFFELRPLRIGKDCKEILLVARKHDAEEFMSDIQLFNEPIGESIPVRSIGQHGQIEPVDAKWGPANSALTVCSDLENAKDYLERNQQKIAGIVVAQKSTSRFDLGILEDLEEFGIPTVAYIGLKDAKDHEAVSERKSPTVRWTTNLKNRLQVASRSSTYKKLTFGNGDFDLISGDVESAKIYLDIQKIRQTSKMDDLQSEDFTKALELIAVTYHNVLATLFPYSMRQVQSKKIDSDLDVSERIVLASRFIDPNSKDSLRELTESVRQLKKKRKSECWKYDNLRARLAAVKSAVVICKRNTIAEEYRKIAGQSLFGACEVQFLTLAQMQTQGSEVDSVYISGSMGAKMNLETIFLGDEKRWYWLLDGIESGLVSNAFKKYHSIHSKIESRDVIKKYLGLDAAGDVARDSNHAKWADLQFEDDGEGTSSATLEIGKANAIRSSAAVDNDFNDPPVQAKFALFKDGSHAFLTEYFVGRVIGDIASRLDSGKQTWRIENKTSEQLGDGDVLVFVTGSSKDAISEIADQSVGKDHLRKANIWREKLRESEHAMNGKYRKLQIELKKAGVDRGIGTIRGWIEDDSTIGPQRYADGDVAAISKIANGFTEAMQRECIASIAIVKRAHLDAGIRLSKVIFEMLEKGRVLDEGETFEFEGKTVMTREIQVLDSEPTVVRRSQSNRVIL